ncbi:MAG: aldo/keto reductase [Pelolinea sp.]|nr:aldo/keto reductase [Pelolinea sp.]
MDPNKRVKLGKTNVMIPQLGLGTNPLGGMFAPISPEEAQATVESCWDLGIRFYDTAPVYGYGNAERAVGAILSKKPRSEFILSTKVGRLLLADGPKDHEDTMVLWDGKQLYKGTDSVKPYFDFSYDGVMRSIEASQKRTGIDRFDFMHIHDPDWFPEEALEGAYKALDQLRSEGSIGAIGCGMNQWEVLADFAKRADFDTFLLAGRYTLLDQSALEILLPICIENHIVIVAGGVYNSGILCNPDPSLALKTDRSSNAIGSWKDNVTYNYVPADQTIVEKTIKLKEICDRYNVPLMAAAIQFPMYHPAISTVVMGPRSVEQARQNVEMFSIDIPQDLWNEMKYEKLLPKEAPTSTDIE